MLVVIHTILLIFHLNTTNWILTATLIVAELVPEVLREQQARRSCSRT